MKIEEIRQDIDLENLHQQSYNQPVVVFKHSTRCAISSMVFSRLKRSWDTQLEDQDLYYLDLIKFRPVSDKIAEKYGVVHESPQILVLKDGKCVYNASHNAISVEDIDRNR